LPASGIEGTEGVARGCPTWCLSRDGANVGADVLPHSIDVPAKRTKM
jgi:hypothetical protein